MLCICLRAHALPTFPIWAIVTTNLHDSRESWMIRVEPRLRAVVQITWLSGCASFVERWWPCPSYWRVSEKVNSTKVTFVCEVQNPFDSRQPKRLRDNGLCQSSPMRVRHSINFLLEQMAFHMDSADREMCFDVTTQASLDGQCLITSHLTQNKE